MVNTIKNIAILLDFVISIIASMVQNSHQKLSGVLFGASAVILFVAVICVVIEWVQNK